MYMNPFKNKIVNTDEVDTSYPPARFVSIKLNSDGSPTSPVIGVSNDSNFETNRSKLGPMSTRYILVTMALTYTLS